MAKRKSNITFNKVTTNPKVEGLGDVIKKVTDFLHIKPCDDCERRRQALNKAFPFTKYVTNEIPQEDMEFMDTVDNNSLLTIELRNRIILIYNTTFQVHQENCNCPGMFRTIIDKVKVQIEYQRINHEK